MNESKQNFTAVFGIIAQDTRIMLVKNRDSAGDERWTLPGGKVEVGETLYAALVREIKEETQCSVKEAQIAYIHECFFLKFSAHVRAFIFKTNVESNLCFELDESINDPSGTVIAKKVVHFHDLPNYIENEQVLKPLQNWLNKPMTAEYLFTENMKW